MILNLCESHLPQQGNSELSTPNSPTSVKFDYASIPYVKSHFLIGWGGGNERVDSLLGTLFESFFLMLFKMTLLRLRMSFWGLWASILVHFEVLFLSF